MNIDFELYRIFHTVAQYENLTKAAYALHISQPAVSKSVKNLESQLGAPVFIRTKKGVTLTKEGEEFYAFIDKAIMSIQNGENRFTNMVHLKEGTLTIGVGATITKQFLLPYLKRYHTLFPNIKIQIITGKTSDLLQGMREGQTDIVFLNTGAHHFGDAFTLTPCKTIHDCFAGGEAFAHLKNKQLTLKDLHHYPLLLPARGSDTRSFLDDICTANDCYLEADMELASFSLLRDFAKAGFGITFCAQEYIHEEIRNHELFVLDVVQDIPERTISFALLNHQVPPFATRALTKLITAQE